MPVQIQVSQLINRPVDTVFDFTVRNHVRNHPRWDPLMELEQLTTGPIRVGSVIRRRNSHSGVPVEGTMEVIELEPNQTVGWLIRDGSAETRARTTYTAVNEGQTKMTVLLELPDMDESIDTEPVRSSIQESFRNIAKLIEEETREH